MAAKRKTRAKRTTLNSVRKAATKTMNQASTRIQRKAKSLQRDAASVAEHARDWADDGVAYMSKTVKANPFWSGALSAAALAAVGMYFARR
jgi:ABC-type transporter Mla subunit MlaD